MDTERFWLLIARRFAGEATPAELKELDLILTQNQEYKRLYKQLSSYWKQSAANNEQQADTAFQKTLNKIRKSGQPAQEEDKYQVVSKARPASAAAWVSWSLRIAAVLLLSAGLGFVAVKLFSPEPVLASFTWIEKHNNKGTKSTITLPDGSTVWLNADSKIKFPEHFSTVREVYLSGEAFFDVKKNPDKPFIIHLNKSRIKVLGTSFNVRAYQDDPVVETSVVSGKVAFIADKGLLSTRHDTLLVTPNYKSIYSSKTGNLYKQQTNGLADKAWTEGRLVFKGMRFEEIARILERTYGKKISFANQAIKYCRITASFQQETLEEIMMIISKTKDYRFTFSDQELIISGAGCQAES